MGFINVIGYGYDLHSTQLTDYQVLVFTLHSNEHLIKLNNIFITNYTVSGRVCASSYFQKWLQHTHQYMTIEIILQYNIQKRNQPFYTLR